MLRQLVNHRRSLKAAWLLFLLFAACARSGPVDIAPGEQRCEYCRMDIVDLRFKAEAVSGKGKPHYFDSVECLARWRRENPDEARRAWVGTYSQPSTWVEWDRAFFLRSEAIHSPMGGHLAAFADEAAAKKALSEQGGEILNASELDKKLEAQNPQPST